MIRTCIALTIVSFVLLGSTAPAWAASPDNAVQADVQADKEKPSDQAMVKAFEDYRYDDSSTTSPAKLALFKALLAAGGNPNAMRGGIPLIFDASTIEMVRVLLEAGADTQAKDKYGRTVLIGRTAGNLAILKALIAAGADRYATSRLGETPLHYVCDSGVLSRGNPDPEAAERIALLKPQNASLDAFVPNTPGMYGTPLASAARQFNPDCVRALIAQGANPDAPADKDATDDTLSVRQEILKANNEYPHAYDAETIKIFKTVGTHDAKPVAEDADAAVIRAFGIYRFEPTMKNLSTLTKLLKAGGNPNATYVSGPLIFDVPDAKMAKLLLAMGANAKFKTKNGETALSGYNAARLDVIKVLLSAGVAIDVANAVGMIPLHAVCGTFREGKPDPEAAKRIALLRPKGHSLDRHYVGQRSRGTPLMFAALTSDNPDCIKALIAAGASPDAQAYSDAAIKNEPVLQGSVREQIAQDVKKHPDSISKEILEILDIH